jgi:AcrR family transcriptional regulator
MPVAPRPRGRPTRPLLSRERILEAAFEVSREQGAAGFSLARVAKHLGVQPPALYNHVKGREEVVAMMRNSFAADIDASVFSSLGWEEAIFPLAWSYRETFARDPEVATLLAVNPVGSAESSLALYRPMAASLRAGGWPDRKIVPVIVALESFIIGSALDLVAQGEITLPEGEDGSGALAVAVRAAREDGRERGVSAADQAFALGLEVMVEGLRARLGRLGG